MKVLILTCHTGDGHNSAAYAMAREMESRGWEYEIADPIGIRSKRAEKVVCSCYNGLIRHTPKAFGLVYHVGRASDCGTLEPLHKCRGEAKSLQTLVTLLKESGLTRGRVCIAHCRNEGAALRLKELLRDALPHVSVAVDHCRGLCSYYAEQGGLLVGFEKE